MWNTVSRLTISDSLVKYDKCYVCKAQFIQRKVIIIYSAKFPIRIEECIKKDPLQMIYTVLYIQILHYWNGFTDRVSAKRTLRCIFRPDAARRLVILTRLHQVIIDHISEYHLSGCVCWLEKFYMVEYWKICFYFPFFSFPILHHVKFGIFIPRLLHF